MPDARTHDLITVATGVVMTPVAYGYLSETMQRGHAEAVTLTLWLVGSHLVSGILFSPDLDLDSRIDNRWGVFYWIWRPYMRVIPHRHFFSHSLIFSPLLRLAYFYLVVTLLLFFWVWVMAQLGLVVPDYHMQLYQYMRAWLSANPEVSAAVLLGFCTGSAAHTIADWSVTNGQRFLRIFGIRITRSYRGHDGSIHQRRVRW